ncbi:MAG: hypothetical protein QG594_549 [Bacteroidota bacterium]|nr:hypothetical protein [Bacteroidota bacterium]
MIHTIALIEHELARMEITLARGKKLGFNSSQIDYYQEIIDCYEASLKILKSNVAP